MGTQKKKGVLRKSSQITQYLRVNNKIQASNTITSSIIISDFLGGGIYSPTKFPIQKKVACLEKRKYNHAHAQAHAW